jgi:DNA polymerase III subunit delta'
MSASATQLDGYPHPREMQNLFGLDEPERSFLDAWNSGRLPHAWILGGEVGIGKATLAYRIARFVLAQGRRHEPAQSLAVAPTHPVSRKVAAGSHADLMLLSRIEKEKGDGFTSNIPVSVVRRTLDILGSTAAEGGWRVCIVDSAEDLDPPSANALLKSIEEPPSLCLFLIIAHQPGRLLPTIRSRCRRLMVPPLQPDALRHAVTALAADKASPAAIEQAIRLSQGSVRRALDRLDPEILALISGLRDRLDRLPRVGADEILGLATQMAGRKGEDIFPLALEVIGEWLGETIRRRASGGAAALAPLIEVWEKATRAAREAEAFNLDRRPLVMALFQDLARVA